MGGYNEGIPPDCDWTLWVLQALLAARFVPPRSIAGAVEFVAAHQVGSLGAFARSSQPSRSTR
jgi:hypothetical protein